MPSVVTLYDLADLIEESVPRGIEPHGAFALPLRDRQFGKAIQAIRQSPLVSHLPAQVQALGEIVSRRGKVAVLNKKGAQSREGGGEAPLVPQFPGDRQALLKIGARCYVVAPAHGG